MPPARRLLAVLLFVPWLAACAPFLAPAGPEPGEAELVELPLGQLRLKTADGYRLLMRSWLPEQGAPRAVILALHGFNDHSTFIEDAAERWAEAGIATYAYDQRGFGTAPNRGLWAGTAAYTGDAADALRLLAARHGVPVFLLGESMGGAVAIATLTRHPDLPVAGAILAAPAVWSRETMPFYQRMGLLMASYTVPWFPLTASGLDIQASDNIQALVVPFLASGFGVFYMRQAMEAVPDSLIEAARIDGMREFDTFWYVARPIVWPALVSLGVFTFVFSWNNFFWPLIVVDSERSKTLPLAIADLSAGQYVDSWPVQMAAGTILIVPLIVVFLFVQRAFVRGVAGSGLKE